METNKLIAAYLRAFDSFLINLLLYISIPLPINVSVTIWPAISGINFDDLEAFAGEEQEIWIKGLLITHLILRTIFGLITAVQIGTGILLLMIFHCDENWSVLRITICKAWYWASFVYLQSLGAGLYFSKADDDTVLLVCTLIFLRSAVIHTLFYVWFQRFE